MTSVALAAAPPGFTLAAAQEQVLAAVNRSGSSFSLAMKTMRREKRLAMFAVYAFARAVDDIADGEVAATEKARQLQEWRDEIEAVYAGRPETGIGLAVADAAARFALPKQEFLLLIEGMEMDAQPIVAPSLTELQAYCRRVAGSVGMLCMPIFGAPPGQASDSFALSLADGLQLTNILRDVREDAAIGRLYLPREMLADQGIAGLPPPEVARHPGTVAVAASLGALARSRFQEARTAATLLDHRVIRPGLMMMGVYEGYLALLARSGWGLAGKPVRLGKLQKLARGLRYAIQVPSQP